VLSFINTTYLKMTLTATNLNDLVLVLMCHLVKCPCCSRVGAACGSLLAEHPIVRLGVGGNLFAAVTDAAMGKQFIAVPQH